MKRPKGKTSRRSTVRERPVQESAPTPRSVRWFWRGLAAICLGGALIRILMVTEFIAENPLAGFPRVDALTYWNWAGRIAGGQLWETTPFFSAPLYPYLVGLLRAVGGSLASLYWVQSLVDLLTAAVLAVACRRRFGAGVGLLAAGLFLSMREPASFSLRALTCTLQLLLLAVVYHQLVAVQASPSIRRYVSTGVALGLLCLSYPPAMLLAVAVVPWLFWQSRRRLADGLRSAIPLGMAALFIAPATIHNWQASGELFFVQSASALTLRQGNLPGSTGIYTPIPNTTVDRERLFSSVENDYFRETGRRGSWSEINRYHRKEVIKFWLSDPGRTFRLVARKVYYFLTGRNYGDVYVPALEIETGLTGRLRLAPIRTAWLMGPALVGLVALIRRPIRYGPELVMFMVPFLVVAAVWYTPRYRLPVIPMLTVVSAWVLWQAGGWRSRPRWALAVAAALVAALATGGINRVNGFDSSAEHRGMFEYSIGAAYAQGGEFEWAAARYRRALELEPGFVQAQVGLAEVLRKAGQVGDSIEHARRLVEADPRSAEAHYSLGLALFEAGQADQAGEHFARAAEHYRLELDSQDGDARLHARLARALSRIGRMDEALREYRQALELDPDYADVYFEIGVILADQGRPDEASAHYRRAVELRPNDADMRCEVGIALLSLGRLPKALGHLQEAVRLDSNHGRALNYLGISMVRQGKVAEAKATFNRAVAIEDAAGEACYNLGVVAEQEGKGSQALTFFERALELDPAYTLPAEVLASRYLAAGRVADAIRVLRIAVSHSPHNVALTNSLAWTLACCPNKELRDGKAALELARRACRLTDFANPDVLRTLAAAYAEVGDLDQAIETARRALQLAEAAGQTQVARSVRRQLEEYLATRADGGVR